MKSLNLLLIQENLVWENPVANRARFTNIIEKENKNADIIVLPETFTTGFPVDPSPYAETMDGETILWMKKTAHKTGAVITGSMLMKKDGNYYNTLVWMTPEGEMKSYDKRHVFTMGGEHEKIKPGNKKLTVEIKGWKIRPLICYDLRFPVWCKNSYNQEVFEYDVLLFTANWPSVRAYPWNNLLVARAIENQSYVIGVNRVGKDGLGNKYSGDTQVVDAKGNVITRAETDKSVVIKSSISMDELVRFREKFDVGRDWDKFKFL